ncbi:MAG TPA: lasso peptide biosynthesis B2 protein [Solirubrobacteraceae bacterium]|nr:lasso peptide biosynthesis B2 protein [Solirubrobacteraceae bacterium]
MSTLPSRLRAVGELRDAREALLFMRVGSVAAAVPLIMRLPLPRVAALVTRPTRRRPLAAAEVEQLERLIALAPRIARPLVRSGCLTRGVTLFWFLRRGGLDVELRFGLDPAQDGATEGHCWLSLDDEPFLEKADPRPRFAELYRLPLRAA